MKKRYLAICAMFLLLAVPCAGRAFAYFTSYAVTAGTYPVSIGDRVTITEDFSRWTKHVRLTADADSGPVYVRARAFHSDAYQVRYEAPEGKWTDGGDGFYYYDDILYAGQTTSELTVYIDGVPEDITDPLDFGVAVIYESTPVRYRPDGTPYADWSAGVIQREEAGHEE